MTRFQISLSVCVLLLWVTSSCHVDCQPLRIGAFNVQLFGQKKASNADVMKILVKIIRRYDLILIQEIRDSKQTAIYTLLNDVNANQPADKQFKMEVSSRLGRSRSKEQYAYMYRPGAGLTITQTLEFDDGDEALNKGKIYYDLFQREPYMIKVASQYTVPSTFVIIGIHVAPDQAVQEINALEGVFEFVKNKMAVENAVVMGDLNADCSYVSRKAWKNIPMRNDPKYTWLIGDDMDTTVKHTHCAYDRFIFTGNDWSKGVDPRSAVVYQYDDDTPLLGAMSFKMATLVSDHYPIEFLLQRTESNNNGPLISLCGVYIALTSGRSLQTNKVYTLTGVSVVEKAERTQPVLIGRLYSSTTNNDLLLLLSDVQKRIKDVRIDVTRDRRKYGRKQKAKLALHVRIDDVPTVKNMFKDILKKFRCTG